MRKKRPASNRENASTADIIFMRKEMEKMKKTVHISGYLLFPLSEGKRAVIQRGGDCICTSCVVEILEQREDYACFETMNSVYCVSAPAPIPVQSAVPLKMCA